MAGTTTGEAPRGSVFWSTARPDQRALTLGFAGLVVLAWITLAAWGASPYGRYLHHGSLEALRVPGPLAAALFVAGWTVMTIAMMLPTAYPVVALFASVTSRRPDHRALLGLCVAGYLGVWAAFGYVAYVADIGVHAAVDQSEWLRDHSWVIAAGVLAFAGAYQFSPLKYRCLDACRSPRVFILRRWTGRRPRHDALALGADAGMYCLGCCWSLMLVMFAAGAGSIPLMVALGTAMAAEKNLSWGTRIKMPLGVALIAIAAAVAIHAR